MFTAIYYPLFAQGSQDLSSQFFKALKINNSAGTVIHRGLTTDTIMKLADSSYISSYDTISASFKLSQKNYYHYDSGGLLLSIITTQPDKTGMNWKNQTRVEKRYTGAFLTQEIKYSWNNDLKTWTPDSRTDYFFSGDMLLESYTEQVYEQDSSLSFTARYSYTYNENEVHTLVKQSWNNNTQQWVNQQKNTYSYLETNISSILIQTWSQSLNNWLDFEQSTYSYSQQKLDEILNERYDQSGFVWNLYSRLVFTYNSANGKVETETLSFRDTDKWNNYSKKEYMYENDIIKTIINHLYYSWLQDWREISEVEYYYSNHEVFGYEDTKFSVSFIQNPLEAGSLIALHHLDSNQLYKIDLISITGVHINLGTYSNNDYVIIPSELKSGTYILRIICGNNLYGTQKIIILH